MKQIIDNAKKKKIMFVLKKAALTFKCNNTDIKVYKCSKDCFTFICSQPMPMNWHIFSTADVLFLTNFFLLLCRYSHIYLRLNVSASVRSGRSLDKRPFIRT